MLIELSNVQKRFGKTVALREIHLVIPSGTRLGLVGPNGSGKSTLLRAVMGLVACEGHVRLDGRSPFENRAELARRLAYVPQFPPQWGALVGEVVRAVTTLRGLDPDRVKSMAQRLGLDLTVIHSRPFRDLSGGMKQKLLIALALATDASLFILDEPTASLDAKTRTRFFHLLDEVAPRATRLFCSHRLDEVRELVERIVVLQEGTVTYDGPVHEYTEDPSGDEVIHRVNAQEPMPTTGIEPSCSLLPVPPSGGIHG